MLESFNGKDFEYIHLTPEEMKDRCILGRIKTRMSGTEATRNNRKYSKELWDKAINDPLFTEKIENKCVLAELGHPTDRNETDAREACACLAEPPKWGPDGYIYGIWDIIDTASGKVLNTLCKYGTKIGISSRGEGDVMEDLSGEGIVDPDTYMLETWDFVLMPANKKCRGEFVTESIGKKTLKQALTEELDKATLEQKEKMQEAIKLVEQENKTIEDLFKDAGVKKVFDKDGYFTAAAEKKYNEVAKNYYKGEDAFDALCNEEHCFKEKKDIKESVINEDDTEMPENADHRKQRGRTAPNKEDMVGFIADHDQAYLDFLHHFGAINEKEFNDKDVAFEIKKGVYEPDISEIEINDVANWICDHKNLCKDFQKKFGVKAIDATKGINAKKDESLTETENDEKYFNIDVYGGYGCLELIQQGIEIYAKNESEAKKEAIKIVKNDYKKSGYNNEKIKEENPFGFKVMINYGDDTDINEVEYIVYVYPEGSTDIKDIVLEDSFIEKDEALKYAKALFDEGMHSCVYQQLADNDGENLEYSNFIWDSLKDNKLGESLNESADMLLTPEEAVKHVCEEDGKITILGKDGYAGADFYKKDGSLYVYNGFVGQCAYNADEAELLKHLQQMYDEGFLIAKTDDWSDTHKLHNSNSYGVSIGESTKECNSVNCTDKKEDQKTKKSATDDGDDVVNELQEALKAKAQSEASIADMQNKLAVGDAKVKDLEEALAKYKDLAIKLSEKAKDLKKLNKKVSNLQEEIQAKDTTVKRLNEALLKNNKASEKKLTESVLKSSDRANKLVESLKETRKSISKLTEELATSRQETKDLADELSSERAVSSKKLEESAQKLDHMSKLVEGYKKAANTTMSKYIESKALMLGVKKEDIRNRLAESYTIADVDKVCEDLRSYKLNISKLPFSIENAKRVRFKESKNDNLYLGNSGDEIDDDLLRMADLD